MQELRENVSLLSPRKLATEKKNKDKYLLVRIIHKIRNRIQPRLTRARVSSRRTPARRTRLRRRVTHVVPIPCAPSLEGMVQPQPMANLVRSRLTLVVVRLAPARD